MATLTENIVLARTRAQDLKSVRKLNCWGSELIDVSIIRKMPNVEVLSLSVNNISTLADFAHCPNLQELYIRKNNIINLNEVCYLQDLPNLKSLWLADNPCTDSEKYRLSVLQALPTLQKLDNIAVQLEEIEYAKVHGSQLIHPLECSSESVSMENTVYCPETVIENKKVVELEVDSNRECKQNNVEIVNGDISPQRYSNIPNSELDKKVPTNMRNSSSMSSLIIENYDNQHTHFEHTVVSQNNIHTSQQPPQHAFQARVKTLVDHSGKSIHSNTNVSSDTVSNEHQVGQFRHSQISRSDSEPDGLASIGDGYRPHNSDNTEYVKDYRYSNYQGTEIKKLSGYNTQKSDKSANVRILPKGGKNRNSNILSAILCLIKELDYASLEVVETAIHCRMEEMDD